MCFWNILFIFLKLCINFKITYLYENKYKMEITVIVIKIKYRSSVFIYYISIFNIYINFANKSYISGLKLKLYIIYLVNYYNFDF